MEIDIETGETQTYIDTNDLTLEETQEDNNIEYSDYKPIQIYYDKINNKLLMIGVYQTMTIPYSAPKKIEETVIYNITNGTELYAKTDIDYEILYVGSFNSQKALIKNPNYQYDLDINLGKAVMRGGRNGRPQAGTLIISKNNIYILSGGEYWESGIFLMKYDFNDDDFTSLSNIDCSAFSIGTDSYYLLNNGTFSELDINTGKYRELEINTQADNIEVCDMGSIGQNLDARFFVVDDDTIIFYDKSMKAFRKLEKNI